MMPAADGSLMSDQLGLRFIEEGNMLRLIDAQTGKPVLTRREQIAHLAGEVARLRALLQLPNGEK